MDRVEQIAMQLHAEYRAAFKALHTGRNKPGHIGTPKNCIDEHDHGWANCHKKKYFLRRAANLDKQVFVSAEHAATIAQVRASAWRDWKNLADDLQVTIQKALALIDFRAKPRCLVCSSDAIAYESANAVLDKVDHLLISHGIESINVIRQRRAELAAVEPVADSTGYVEQANDYAQHGC